MGDHKVHTDSGRRVDRTCLGSHTSYTVLSGTLSDVVGDWELGTCQAHSQGQLAFRTGILADLLSGWKRKTQSEACWYLAVWKKEKKKKRSLKLIR